MSNYRERNDYFIFPFAFENITDKSSDSRFTVKSKYNVQKLDERLIERKLKQNISAIKEDFRMIIEEDRFSEFYYIIKKLTGAGDHKLQAQQSSAQDLKLLNLVLDNLNTYFQELTHKITQLQNNQRKEDLVELCLSFKMSLFLLFFTLQNSVIRKSKSLMDKVNQQGEQINLNVRNSGKQGDIEYQENQLIDQQSQSLKLLNKSLKDISFRYLFQDQHVDDELYRYYMETCLKLLESQQLIKETKTRHYLFRVFNYVMEELQKDEVKQMQLKIMHLIFQEEQMVVSIADYLRNISQNSDYSFGVSFTQELLQLIVTDLQDKTGLQNETTLLKNARQFFQILSDQIPKQFYNNLRIFLSLLDSESYVLRNSIYEIMLNVMKKVLIDIPEGDESKQKTKENLINIFIQRIKDKNAFCRSQVLQCLSEACQVNLIPMDYLKIFLKEAIGRTKDQGAIVRKKALALIQNIVKFYQHIYAKNATFLSKKDIKRELEIAKQKIQEQDEKIELIQAQHHKILNPESQQQSHEEQALNDILKSYDINLRKENEPIELYEEYLMELREQCAQKILQIKEKNLKLIDYSSFIEVVDILVPNLVQMLGSKNVGDVSETIKLLTQLKKFNIESAQQGMRKMLVLIFSSEKAIKEEVLNTYHTIYTDNKIMKNKRIANNLIGLLKEANLTEEKSFEELLLNMIDNQDKKKDISNDVFKECWETFTQQFKFVYDISIDEEENQESNQIIQQAGKASTIPNMNLDQKAALLKLRSALKIIRIASQKRKKIIGFKQLESFKSMLDKLQNAKDKVDWVIIREICLIVEMAKNNKNCEEIIQILKKLIQILVKNHGTENGEWYLAADEIIKLIFLNKNNPEQLVQYILIKLSYFIDQEKSGQKSQKQSVNKSKISVNKQEPKIQIQDGNKSDEDDIKIELEDEPIDDGYTEEERQIINENIIFEKKLSQSLYVSSNVCLRYLLHQDNIEEFLNKIRHEVDNKQQKKSEEKQNKPEKKNNKKKNNKKKGNIEEDDEESESEDEFDQIYGGTEGEYEERLKELNKIEEQFTDDSQFFKYYKNLSQSITLNYYNSLKRGEDQSDRNSELDRIAVLSLIKFMCMSTKFFKENINLLFSFIDPESDFSESIDNIIKTNILIGLGDLYRRYTNLLEPKLHLVYQTLKDKNSQVRKTSLMVITHLVLIDKLKVKAEISNIAVLIEDSNVSIQNQVKLFFHELNKKDPKQIYNFLPDIITNLSDDSVDENIFTNFSKNVLATVIKDNPNDAMVDKMIQRFEIATRTQEKRHIVQTMTLFSYTEKSVKRLLEKFEVFRPSLQDERILECFKSITKKAKQFGAKTPELKILIEELENKIDNYKKENFDDLKYKRQKKDPKKKPQKKQQQQKNKQTSRRSRRMEESEEDDDSLIEEEGNDFQIKSKKQNNAQQFQKYLNPRQVRQRSQKKVLDWDEEEDFEE